MTFLSRLFTKRKVDFPAEIRSVASAPAGANSNPEPAPIGYINERSARHIAGWAYDPARPGFRAPIEVVLVQNGLRRVVASGVADQYSRVLSMLAMDDAIHAFRIHFAEPLDDADAQYLEVFAAGAATPLPLDPKLRERWEPITHVALDIVDNCNLRCPFCLYDYRGVNKTNFMSKAAFASAMRLLPLTGAGHFWLSCFHEPTLHPEFLELIELIPMEYRDNVFFTTNLAKRMPDDYFASLARSGLNHINISIESLDPAIYERMRKGARHRIFMENWDKLLEAFGRANDPPRLRYIMMAYKSNFDEIPGLVKHLIEDRRAWNVEVRDTYLVPHLPPGFRETEFLTMDQWRALDRELGQYPVQTVALSLPSGFSRDVSPVPPAEATVAHATAAGVAPGGETSAPIAEVVELPAPASSPPAHVDAGIDTVAAARAARIPGLFEIKMSWNGDMTILPALAGDYPSERHDARTANIQDIDDPHAYFLKASLERPDAGS